MGNRRILLWLTTVSLLIPAAAMAETPDGTVRLFGALVNPGGDFNGDIVGVATTIEADSTAGIGVTYEVRVSDLFGLEFGLLLADFDFELSAMGMTAAFGSALMMPVTTTLNFHIVRNDSLDLHLGPTVAYTLWGDLDSDFGSATLDDSFDLGINAGLDISVGSSGWSVYLGAQYLQSSAGDSSIEIDVDPLWVQIGFAKSF